MSKKKCLLESQCVPCQGGVEPLKGKRLEDLLGCLSQGWGVVEGQRLEKEYKFKDFVQALGFVNKVGQLAESQGHHPDICLSWGKVKLTIWTHKVNGLHENDFILAAKADELLLKK